MSLSKVEPKFMSVLMLPSQNESRLLFSFGTSSVVLLMLVPCTANQLSVSRSESCGTSMSPTRYLPLVPWIQHDDVGPG